MLACQGGLPALSSSRRFSCLNLDSSLPTSGRLLLQTGSNTWARRCLLCPATLHNLKLALLLTTPLQGPAPPVSCRILKVGARWARHQWQATGQAAAAASSALGGGVQWLSVERRAAGQVAAAASHQGQHARATLPAAQLTPGYSIRPPLSPQPAAPAPRQDLLHQAAH
jgi:hypothetical protein